jgi:hypothetical protein
MNEIVERDGLDAAVEAKIVDVLFGDANAVATARQFVWQLTQPGIAERLNAVRIAAEEQLQRDSCSFMIPSCNTGVDVAPAPD